MFNIRLQCTNFHLCNSLETYRQLPVITSSNSNRMSGTLPWHWVAPNRGLARP